MTTATDPYVVRETDDRVYAVDSEGVEICGAFHPIGHAYWQLYVSKSVSALTELRTPPHRENFWGDHGKVDSRAWVELIAKLYSMAREGNS